MKLKSFADIPVTPDMQIRARARRYCEKALMGWLYKGRPFVREALRQCHGPIEIEEVRRMISECNKVKKKI